MHVAWPHERVSHCATVIKPERRTRRGAARRAAFKDAFATPACEKSAWPHRDREPLEIKIPPSSPSYRCIFFAARDSPFNYYTRGNGKGQEGASWKFSAGEIKISVVVRLIYPSSMEYLRSVVSVARQITNSAQDYLIVPLISHRYIKNPYFEFAGPSMRAKRGRRAVVERVPRRS